LVNRQEEEGEGPSAAVVEVEEEEGAVVDMHHPLQVALMDPLLNWRGCSLVVCRH